jgi:hypothetical protein
LVTNICPRSGIFAYMATESFFINLCSETNDITIIARNHPITWFVCIVFILIFLNLVLFNDIGKLIFIIIVLIGPLVYMFDWNRFVFERICFLFFLINRQKYWSFRWIFLLECIKKGKEFILFIFIIKPRWNRHIQNKTGILWIFLIQNVFY